jgi:hypothetical protein
MMRWQLLLVGVALSIGLVSPMPVQAHVGAPYPVLLEEPVGPYLASALADPDVGIGTFYILITMPDGNPVPDATTVTIKTEPEDGHLAQAAYGVQRQDTRYGERFVAKVPFDTEGPWQIGLAIEGNAGEGEVSFPVEVTPSGIGWLATLGCLVPFALLGALWLRGALRQRQKERV